MAPGADNEAMKRSAALSILFTLAALASPAQDLTADLHSPFVSHLDAQVNRDEVVLNWRDAPNLGDAVYEILRSESAIDSANLGNAETAAVVASGIETFTDRPGEGISWWYAVLAVVDGVRFEMVIPWRNATGAAVSVAGGGPEKAADTAAVYALTAEAEAASVRLDYVADRDDAQVTVFRSPRPFDGPEAMDHAVTVGTRTGASGTLTDTPIPGVAWYYAAVDTALFNAADPRWTDYAAFSRPVSTKITEGDSRAAAMRPAPLPLLRITRSFLDGQPIPEIDGELPERKRLPSSVISALAAVLGPMQGELWTEPAPVILDVDKGYSEDRLQGNLRDILTGSFAEGEWELADSELFALSASNGIDGALKARIQFYRGQCQYFLNDPQSAFLSFLYASDYYYPASRKWMLVIYDDLTPVS